MRKTGQIEETRETRVRSEMRGTGEQEGGVK